LSALAEGMLSNLEGESCRAPSLTSSWSWAH
jgi:hypothetical protein